MVEQASVQQVIQQERQQCATGLAIQLLQQAPRTVERTEAAAMVASAQWTDRQSQWVAQQAAEGKLQGR